MNHHWVNLIKGERERTSPRRAGSQAIVDNVIKSQEIKEDEIPELDPEFQPAWQSWLDLTYFRTKYVGLNVLLGPIPLSEISIYFDMRGVPDRYRLELMRQIQIIDREYTEYENTKPRPKPPTQVIKGKKH